MSLKTPEELESVIVRQAAVTTYQLSTDMIKIQILKKRKIKKNSSSPGTQWIKKNDTELQESLKP